MKAVFKTYDKNFLYIKKIKKVVWFVFLIEVSYCNRDWVIPTAKSVAVLN